MDACQELRTAWLEDASLTTAQRGHAAGCAACRSWIAGAEALVDALRGLPRVELPRELEDVVVGELEQPSPDRFVQALESLPRRSAPPELERRVGEDLALEVVPEEVEPREAEPREAARLRVLDLPNVPSVLERLIDEELASPAAHVIERFVGDLERREAPSELLERLEREQTRRRRTQILVLPLTAVAAASLLFWIALRSSGDSAERSFRVVRAEEGGRLNPLARDLGESLFGGMPRRDLPSTGPMDRRSDADPDHRAGGG